MPVICEACGKLNRTNAMFCGGCAGRLPAFAPTGPSALDALKSWRPPLARAPVAARAHTLPAETLAFWLRLGIVGLAMATAFVAWYLYVTRAAARPPVFDRTAASTVVVPGRASAALDRVGGSAAPGGPNMPSTPTVPPAVAPSQRPSVAEAPVPVAVPKAITPAPAAIAPRSGPVEAIADARDDRVPDRVPDRSADRVVARATGPAEAVADFYRALSDGDGATAAASVTPDKRGTGPFNEASMSRFYRSFDEPLVVRSIRQVDDHVVEAKYTYRVSRTRCNGTAMVETESVRDRTLIRRIRANC